MSPLEIGYICIGIMFILLFLGTPVAVSMGLVGFVGSIWMAGANVGLGILKTVPIGVVSGYEWCVLPLFVLMGQFCFFSGLTGDLYKVAHKWLGHLPGGLAMATIGGCAGFAAVSGSSLATAATMGAVALPEMKKVGYDDGLATGTVTAGGGIGILIPPSAILILYGILAEQSIGKLFLAGIIPGIIQSVMYIGVIYVLCKIKPSLGPPVPEVSLREKVFGLKDTWGVAVLFTLVLGGIYSGIVTVNEAAGAGALGAFFLILIKGKLTRKVLSESLITTCKTTGMIMFIVIGAEIFNYCMVLTRLPNNIASAVGGLNASPYVILCIVLLIYILLGCVLDAFAMVLLTVPIFNPLIVSLGFDPIWFGVTIVMVFELAVITPPIGMNVFVIHGIAKGVPMETIFRGIIPFAFAAVLLVIVITMFPEIVLFLPSRS